MEKVTEVRVGCEKDRESGGEKNGTAGIRNKVSLKMFRPRGITEGNV